MTAYIESFIPALTLKKNTNVLLFSKQKRGKQAQAELGKAQLKPGLDFTLIFCRIGSIVWVGLNQFCRFDCIDLVWYILLFTLHLKHFAWQILFCRFSFVVLVCQIWFYRFGLVYLVQSPRNKLGRVDLVWYTGSGDLGLIAY